MAKKHRSVSAAQKAGSLYFYDKKGVKKLAVTAEQLNAWKKKNKGKYKGNALTAWANNKGKNIGSDEKKSEITVRKLSPATVGKGRGDGEMELFQRKVDKRKAQRADSPGKGSDEAITYKGGASAQQKGANTPNKRTSKNSADPFGTKTKRSSDSAPKPDNKMNKGGLPMVNKGGKMVPFYAADGIGKMNKGGMTKKGGMTYNIGGMVKSQTNNLKKGRS